jgi:hypothetical protein
MEKLKSKKHQKMDRSLAFLNAIAGFVYAHERNLPEPSWIKTYLFEKFKIYLDSNFSFPYKNPKSLDEAFGLFPSSLENALYRERDYILVMEVCVLKEALKLKSFDRAINLVLAFEGQTTENNLPDTQTKVEMYLRQYPTPLDDVVESIMASRRGGLDWIRWGIPLHWFPPFEFDNFRKFFFKRKKELAPSIEKIKHLSTELRKAIRQQFSDWAEKSKNLEYEYLIISKKKRSKN